MEKLLKVFVIIAAIGFGLYSWSWFSTKRALDDYAQRVKPGMQVFEARTYARQMGFKYVGSSLRDEAGRFRDLVTSSGVMGRYVFEIRHDGTLVIEVARQFRD